MSTRQQYGAAPGHCSVSHRGPFNPGTPPSAVGHCSKSLEASEEGSADSPQPNNPTPSEKMRLRSIGLHPCLRFELDNGDLRAVGVPQCDIVATRTFKIANGERRWWGESPSLQSKTVQQNTHGTRHQIAIG